MGCTSASWPARSGAEARPAHPEEVTRHLGVAPGSIGPVKVEGVSRVLADESLREGRYVVGANREGYHLTGVAPGQDFACEFVDLQVALPGEGCPRCGKPLAVERVIEIGNIFKLGTKYSEALNAVYLDESGQQRPIVMGSYGIGPARITAAAVEQRHDADGIIWPWSIAPFQVHVVPIAGKDGAQTAAAEAIYAELQGAGFDVLMDDRDERAGVKFKDADLLGCPDPRHRGTGAGQGRHRGDPRARHPPRPQGAARSGAGQREGHRRPSRDGVMPAATAAPSGRCPR